MQRREAVADGDPCGARLLVRCTRTVPAVPRSLRRAVEGRADVTGERCPTEPATLQLLIGQSHQVLADSRRGKIVGTGGCPRRYPSPDRPPEAVETGAGGGALASADSRQLCTGNHVGCSEIVRT